MKVRVTSHLAARFAGLYAMRQSGYVLRSAAVLGALGSSVEVLESAQGLALRGTSDDKRISGDGLCKPLVKLEHHVDLNAPLRMRDTLVSHDFYRTALRVCRLCMPRHRASRRNSS